MPARQPRVLYVGPSNIWFSEYLVKMDDIVLTTWRDLTARVQEKISAINFDYEDFFNDYLLQATAEIQAVGGTASFPKVKPP